MSHELLCEDDYLDYGYDVHTVKAFEEEVGEDDALMDSKISVGRFAKIIDEFDVADDEFDEGDIDLDSMGLSACYSL